VQRIKVLIAEDDPVVREALSDMLSEEEGIDVVGAAANTDDTIATAVRTKPSVVLCDVRMPGGGGPRATTEILQQLPKTHVLALSAHDDRTTVIGMLQAGAVGFLIKGAPADDIVDAIRLASRGESSLSTRIAGQVIRELVGQLELHDHEAGLRRKRSELMRGVVKGGGITMVFQPIVDLRTLDVVGVEALARFGGKPLRSPSAWFEEASQVGMRIDLELATARAALAGRPRLARGLYMAVNISPQTAVSPSFPIFMAEEPLEGVVFEISEHARVEDYDELNAVLTEVRGRGGRLAIDDAGAGFASLQHILRLSPDLIKLDMGLTRHVDTDPARRALASALTSFAEDIGAGLIAEGIETAGELDALRGLHVAFGQGFHLGKPASMPAGTVRRSRR
jgi:EAL domain-containing protein (putative c-di-GMP-specific phosphodiesterase class I)/AmiR/NasT family two-component response regulator